jgi:hypothetical protein
MARAKAKPRTKRSGDRRVAPQSVVATVDGGLAELTRRAASDPHPARVEHGRTLTDFTGGAAAVTDAAAVASPAPPPSAFR